MHRLDAGHLVRLAVEDAPAGSQLHGVAEEGVPTRAIAEAIRAGLHPPVVSVPADQAGDHFGWLARCFGVDARAWSTCTRELPGRQPEHPGLLEDLGEGHCFRTEPD